jgi:hypothetical protein
MEQALGQRLCPEWPQAYARVETILDRVARASRAVKCIKPVVRLHQGRHRHVSQGMVDLKQLYGNGRAFRYGKRQRSCPYELLGLKRPPHDWGPLLQMDPKECEQELLTQAVMV